MPNIRKAGPAPDSSDFPKIGDQVGNIVVLEPLEETVVKTKDYGTSEATKCVGWAWNGKALEDLGEVYIFWGRVRAQLHDAIEAQEVVVGRIAKKGRAYVLDADSVPDETVKAIEAQLTF